MRGDTKRNLSVVRRSRSAEPCRLWSDRYRIGESRLTDVMGKQAVVSGCNKSSAEGGHRLEMYPKARPLTQTPDAASVGRLEANSGVKRRQPNDGPQEVLPIPGRTQ